MERKRPTTEAANLNLYLGKANGQSVFIEPFHTLFAGQTNLSGKTTTIIALAGEAVKKGYTVLFFDTKPTIREFDSFNLDIPVCYQPTTDSLVLISLLEAIFKRKITIYYSTLNRLSERAKDIKDVIHNAELMEQTAKNGFIKDACHTLADLLRRLDQELSQTRYTTRLELRDGYINVMPINKLSNEAQQLVLKTAFEEVLRHHNRNTIVVVDEAFRFFPQDYGSACKKAGQDLITQGAKTKLFVWISTQFLAPTDKDPLKACPNKLFGRQDHNTEIDAAIKLVPGGKKTLNPDQIMTLKRGEFLYVPLEGKPKKVLVTPPWERELPKTAQADVQQIRGLVSELNEKERRIKELEQINATYRKQAEADAGEAARSLSEKASAPPIADGAPPSFAIDHRKTIVQIHHKEPVLATLSTKVGKGQIVYVLVNDLKGGPAGMKEIFDAMAEYGWTMNPNTFSPNTGGLVRDGYLLKEGDRFRVPGKVKIEVVKS